MNIPKDSLSEAIEQAADSAVAGLPFQTELPIEIVVSQTQIAGFPVLQVWMNNRRVGQQFAGSWFWLPYPNHPLRHAHEGDMIRAIQARTLGLKQFCMSSDVTVMINQAAPTMTDAVLAEFISIATIYQNRPIKALLETEALSRSSTAAAPVSKIQGRL
jgi:hypothetical protein